MVILSEDEVREAFESWARTKGATDEILRREESGAYADLGVRGYWPVFLSGYEETRRLREALGELPSFVVDGPPVPDDLQSAVRGAFPIPDGFGVVSAVGYGDTIELRIGKLEESGG